jgi:hypothetical protein
MRVVTVCPLRVASLVWQPFPGGWTLTVVCKATYQLAPGESVLAQSQEYVQEEENHWNDDPQHSLYAPSDLAPYKPSPEVMLVGHASAPDGEQVARLLVHLVVGEVDKSIELRGDQAFMRSGNLRDGPRFGRMPLRYERAAGGPGTPNPVGMPLDSPNTLGVIALPNLRPPGLAVVRPGDFIEPVGFGPIAASWPTRRQRLGRHAGVWSEAALTREPMPEGIDPSYFMSAPRDQALTVLRPDERIVLENLHPKHARLVTSLPGVEPRAFVELPHQAVTELPLVCDTLWIDTDRSICTLTWRGQLALQRPTQEGQVVVAMAKAGRALTWAEVEPLTREGASPQGEDEEAEVNETIVTHRRAPSSPALPFSNPPADAWGPPSVTAAAQRAGGAPGRDGDGTGRFAAMKAEPAVGPAWLAPARVGAAAPGVVAKPSIAPDMPWPPAAQISTPPPLTRQPPPPPPSMRPPSPPAVPARPPPPPPPPVMPAPVPAPIPQPRVSSPWAATPGPAGSALAAFGAAPPAPSAPVAAAAPSAPSAPRTAFVSSAASLEVRDEAGRGAAAASNAAALAAAASAATPAAPALGRSPEPATGALFQGPTPAAPGAREHVDLLWFDPAAVPRIRASGAPSREPAPQAGSVAWLKDDAGARTHETQEVKDRRDVLRVLTRTAPITEDALAPTIAAAFREDGSFEPPMTVVAGELALAFDELDALKATIAVATPFIGTDKKLREVVTTATELTKSEWPAPADVAENLTLRLEEAFAQGPRTVAPGYLQSSVKRLLLEARSYQKKSIFGERRIRALFHFAGGRAPIPAYLPETLGARLPLFLRFRASAIVELRPQEDQYETHTDALLVVALGRLVRERG